MDVLTITSASSMEWIWNEYFEIGMVLEGTLILQAGTQKELLRPGDGFFINAQVRHCFRNADRNYVLLYHALFLPRLVGGSADSIYWQKYIYPLLHNTAFPLQVFYRKEDSDKETLDHIMHVFRIMQYHILGYELLVRNELSFILLDLFGRQHYLEESISTKQLRNEERIRTMISYIETHYPESITLQDLADSALISVSECIRCFRETLQETPANYVRMFRLIKAADEIIHTDKTISSIAYDCGFQEVSYFNRCFKAQYKTTPLLYRQKNQ